MSQTTTKKRAASPTQLDLVGQKRARNFSIDGSGEGHSADNGVRDTKIAMTGECHTKLEPLFSVPLPVLFQEVGAPQAKKPLLIRAEAQCFIQIGLLIYELDVIMRTSETALYCRHQYRLMHDHIVRHRNPFLYPLLPILHVWNQCALQSITKSTHPLVRVRTNLQMCRKTLQQCAEQNWMLCESLQEALEMTGVSSAHSLADGKRKLAELEEEVGSRLDMLFQVGETQYDAGDGSNIGQQHHQDMDVDDDGEQEEHRNNPNESDETRRPSMLSYEMKPIHDICVEMGLLEESLSVDDSGQTEDSTIIRVNAAIRQAIEVRQQQQPPISDSAVTDSDLTVPKDPSQECQATTNSSKDNSPAKQDTVDMPSTESTTNRKTHPVMSTDSSSEVHEARIASFSINNSSNSTTTNPSVMINTLANVCGQEAIKTQTDKSDDSTPPSQHTKPEESQTSVVKASDAAKTLAVLASGNE